MAGQKTSRKQQARITFTPLSNTSPAAKDYHQQIKDRAAAVRYETHSTSPLKRKHVEFSSPDHAQSAYLPTPDGLADEEHAKTASHGKHKLKRTRQQRLDLTALTPPTQTSASPRAKATTPPINELSSDSDDMPRTSRKKPRLKGGFMSSARTSRGQQQLRIDNEVVSPASAASSSRQLPKESDSEDDMPTTAGQRKRVSKRRLPSPSPSVEAPSEDEIQVVEARTVSPTHESEDEDELPRPTPKRRLLKKRAESTNQQQASSLTQQDRNDLNEDLDFLEPDSDVDAPRAPRSTQNVRKNARMAALDALKRKRSGAAASDPVPVEREDSYEEEDPNIEAPPTSSKSMFQADDEDEDFVDDGDADVLGVPEDLPIEFSKYASMKPKDLFKYAVEWMVQKKINPAFDIKDNLYDLTFTKLNDEVSGLVSSRYSSAAWTADFTLALRARPHISVQDLTHTIDDVAAGHCDACNRSNHPATFLIQFHGKPYHLDTLDDVEVAGKDDSDSDSDEQDEDGEKARYDAQGRAIPPVSMTFQVGRFCAANAETAHELSHWKLNLYEWVVDWINERGYNTAARIIERDQWSTKKRRKHANKIADKMHDQGVTRMLWKEFQDTINRARESKQGRYQ